jgi:hypothetical protein
VPAYPARETRKAYSVSRVWANAGGLDVTRALLGRQRAEATALPNWIKPQLTKLVDQPPDGPEWLHEIKFDGYRMHARLDRGAVVIPRGRCSALSGAAGKLTRTVLPQANAYAMIRRRAAAARIATLTGYSRPRTRLQVALLREGISGFLGCRRENGPLSAGGRSI